MLVPKDSSLCFTYHPGPNSVAKQCGNGKTREVCVKVNSYTRFYFDHINHHNSGGCKMPWQLRVPQGSPKWLLQSRFFCKSTNYDDYYGDAPTRECGRGPNHTILAEATNGQMTIWMIPITGRQGVKCNGAFRQTINS